MFKLGKLRVESASPQERSSLAEAILLSTIETQTKLINRCTTLRDRTSEITIATATTFSFHRRRGGLLAQMTREGIGRCNQRELAARRVLDHLICDLEATDPTVPSLSLARAGFMADRANLTTDGLFFVTAQQRINRSAPKGHILPPAAAPAASKEDRADIIRRELHHARRSRNPPASRVLEEVLSGY